MARVLLVAATLLAAALAGCMGVGACAGAQGAGGQQAVCNESDRFFYGGQVGGKSATETYTWENTGTSATVQWGGQGAGSFTLTVLDAAGTQVYQRPFGGGQAGAGDATQAGQAGDWTVRLDFSGFSGQMGLSLTKR